MDLLHTHTQCCLGQDLYTDMPHCDLQMVGKHSFVFKNLEKKKIRFYLCLCVYFVDGGTLLKHPSAAMTKLINSVKEDKSGMQMSNQDKALTRPVMSFIVQRHDLDGLQLAMRQALRKATCRVFGLQVS